MYLIPTSHNTDLSIKCCLSSELRGRVSQGHRILHIDLHALVTQSNKRISCAIARIVKALVRVQLTVVVYFNIPPVCAITVMHWILRKVRLQSEYIKGKFLKILFPYII